jgi:hypothetical protein
MTGLSVVRVFLAVVGVAMLLGGVAVALTAPGGAAINAVWLILGGIVVLVVAVMEIVRYRSEAAERVRGAPGPGGGEPGAPEPRFQPTEETFIDPTTKRRMRVYLDARTGERRYVAEG